MSGGGLQDDREPVVAVVGVIVPDEARFHGPAFNRAGQMFQDELVAGLVRAGLDVDRVFSIEPVPGFPRARRLFGATGRVTTRSGLPVRLLPFLNVRPFKTLTVGLATFVALTGWAWRNRRRARIVHVFNLTMPPGLAVWLAARLTGSFVTVSVLDVWKPGALVPDTWAHRADYLMLRALMPRFDGHMVVSPAIREDLLPGRRVCMIEGGVAPDRFRRVATEVRGTPDVFRVVLSGSLEAYNGVELALSAVALLPADVELVIAGTGTLAGHVREWAQHEPRVTYAGFLSFEDVLVLYRSADLLLNARLTKAIDTRYFFPSKLMELLASGTPVLSTCTGQVESEYGDVLYLLREETPAALAARILEIRSVDRDDRTRLGGRAREFMFREKTWERQGQRLAQYLRQEVCRNLVG